jgi:hypothetical protein
LKKLISAICLFCLVNGMSFAEETVQTSDGRSILLKDDGSWVELSGDVDDDEIILPRLWDLTDLKLDILKLRGQWVRVKADVSPLGADLVTLSDPKQFADMSSLMGSTINLDRESRKQLLQDCPEKCKNALVFGKVAVEGPDTAGIMVTRIDFE